MSRIDPSAAALYSNNGKSRSDFSRYFLLLFIELLSFGSLYGAGICTSAALDALISVDNVLAVALGDSLYGALCCASAAGDAIITDNVCHLQSSSFLYLPNCITLF